MASPDNWSRIPTLAGRTPCRQCRKRVASKSPGRIGKSGLCSICYRDVSVGHVKGKLPPKPTDERPGTDEKILVLTERAARRECLWHPEDF
jgi:hypothetical protein